MRNNEMPAIVNDVEVPPGIRVPSVWANDRIISFAALGVLRHVVSYPVGAVVPSEDLSQGWSEGDSPAAVVAELVEAGYLLPDGPNRFRLVHPARLGPMPTA